MSNPSDNRMTDRLPPGAERFWGQVSETRAGRSGGNDSGEEGAGGGPDGQARSTDETHCLEWCPICRSADLLRATAPPEAIGQVQAIQQEAVNVLKAFVSAYAERGAGPAGGSADRSREAGAGPGRQADSPGDTPGERPFRDIRID
jgi:hypothetical protein